MYRVFPKLEVKDKGNVWKPISVDSVLERFISALIPLTQQKQYLHRLRYTNEQVKIPFYTFRAKQGNVVCPSCTCWVQYKIQHHAQTQELVCDDCYIESLHIRTFTTTATTTLRKKTRFRLSDLR